ncbi:hypothetical protein CPB85DRAFT_1009531 [Mucidula mucida]|nr:hypothetical protein CPB85DRAFT_1009531 [Mucidula mucida]
MSCCISGMSGSIRWISTNVGGVVNVAVSSLGLGDVHVASAGTGCGWAFIHVPLITVLGFAPMKVREVVMLLRPLCALTARASMAWSTSLALIICSSGVRSGSMRWMSASVGGWGKPSSSDDRATVLGALTTGEGGAVFSIYVKMGLLMKRPFGAGFASKRQLSILFRSPCSCPDGATGTTSSSSSSISGHGCLGNGSDGVLGRADSRDEEIFPLKPPSGIGSLEARPDRL